ncbi:MAG: hypothetical protein IID63_04690 [candidate division Zixibacteria bacterium]|nr:hypothetical protein [candidate division Zixibacteria bacterium]
MTSQKTYRKVTSLTLVALLLLAASAMNSPNENEVCEVTIDVGDTTAYPNTSNNVVPITIENPVDTIVGFQLWIQLDRPPDFVIFQTDTFLEFDTTHWRCNAYSGPNCIDSTLVPFDSVWDFFHVDTFEVERANIDTAGTLIAGWEFLVAQSLALNGTDLLITGIANLPGGPITPGFAPQSGGTLINMLADVLDVSDTVTNRIVNMAINTIFIDNFNIVMADPSWSPWTFETYWDTIGWICTDWLIDTTQNPPDTVACLSWQHTSIPPWDSIVVVLDSIISLDTTRICITDGSLEVLLRSYICGDANGDGTPGNILDLTFLVDRIFRGGPPSDPPEAADFNCDGFYGNILDLTIIVDFVFRGGDPLCSAPECSK